LEGPHDVGEGLVTRQDELVVTVALVLLGT
jgi:hypothetical protein